MKIALALALGLIVAPVFAQDPGKLELSYTYENCIHGCRFVEYRLNPEGKADYIRRDEDRVTDDFSVQLDPGEVAALSKLIEKEGFFRLDENSQWLTQDAGTQILEITLGDKTKTVKLKDDPLCESAKPFCTIIQKFLWMVDAKRDYQIKIGRE